MTLILTREHILIVAPSQPDPEAVVAALLPVLARYEIDRTPERLGMFLAQWSHESSFVCQAENLNYSAKRLTQVWPSRFPTLASAREYAMNPQALANRVYNGRMGNQIGSDHGWLYRGRGWCQLTGRDAYATYGRQLGLDLVGNPDLLLQDEVSAAVCGLFWSNRGLNRLADQGDFLRVTEAINGGQNGLADRIARYRRVIGPLREPQAERSSASRLAAAVAAQQALVHPVTRLFVNGVEVPLAHATVEEGFVTTPAGRFRVVKDTRVGEKRYVTTT